MIKLRYSFCWTPAAKVPQLNRKRSRCSTIKRRSVEEVPVLVGVWEASGPLNPGLVAPVKLRLFFQLHRHNYRPKFSPRNSKINHQLFMLELVNIVFRYFYFTFTIFTTRMSEAIGASTFLTVTRAFINQNRCSCLSSRNKGTDYTLRTSSCWLGVFRLDLKISICSSSELSLLEIWRIEVRTLKWKICSTRLTFECRAIICSAQHSYK